MLSDCAASSCSIKSEAFDCARFHQSTNQSINQLTLDYYLVTRIIMIRHLVEMLCSILSLQPSRQRELQLRILHSRLLCCFEPGFDLLTFLTRASRQLLSLYSLFSQPLIIYTYISYSDNTGIQLKVSIQEVVHYYNLSILYVYVYIYILQYSI